VKMAIRGAKPNLPHGLFPLEPLRKKAQNFISRVNATHEGTVSIPYEEQLDHLSQLSSLKEEAKQW